MRVLVTGMSGTGKSSVLPKLAERGHRVVDTDTDQWSQWVVDREGRRDWVWRKDAITELLKGHRDGTLFVAGCKTNQKEFYPLFEHVVLLHAPASVLLERIATRSTNDYGKSADERDEILRNLEVIEPLLHISATAKIDASAPLAEVVRLSALR